MTLLEFLCENNNLRELIIEPTHCHFNISTDRNYTICNVIDMLKKCMPNLQKFSIGCVEVFAHYFEDYLNISCPRKVTHLGLASVKDNPNEYEAAYFEPELIASFVNLKVRFLLFVLSSQLSI